MKQRMELRERHRLQPGSLLVGAVLARLDAGHKGLVAGDEGHDDGGVDLVQLRQRERATAGYGRRQGGEAPEEAKELLYAAGSRNINHGHTSRGCSSKHHRGTPQHTREAQAAGA